MRCERPCGAQRSSSSEGGSRTVAGPAQQADGTFARDGWTFKVAPWWVVREGPRLLPTA
jgi:hypothetical protein